MRGEAMRELQAPAARDELRELHPSRRSAEGRERQGYSRVGRGRREGGLAYGRLDQVQVDARRLVVVLATDLETNVVYAGLDEPKLLVIVTFGDDRTRRIGSLAEERTKTGVELSE